MEVVITKDELAGKIWTILSVTEAGSRRREWALDAIRLTVGDMMFEYAMASLMDEQECRPII